MVWSQITEELVLMGTTDVKQPSSRAALKQAVSCGEGWFMQQFTQHYQAIAKPREVCPIAFARNDMERQATKVA
jgi:hypothetical protein